MLANQEIWLEIIRVTPAILWVVFAFVVLVVIQEPLLRYVLPHIASPGVGDVEISLTRFEQSMERVIRVAAKNLQWDVQVPEEDKARLMARIRRNHDILRGSRVLLFDDRPENLINEIRMLTQLDVEVETAASLNEAVKKLEHDDVDLLVSDIARPQGQPNGIATLQTLLEMKPALPAIFYIGAFYKSDGVPPQAFGITNRPDELVHLMLDILERRRL